MGIPSQNNPFHEVHHFLFAVLCCMMKSGFITLSHPRFPHNCRRAEVAACWPVLILPGGGRGSDSLSSQFDPAVRRIPMSGSSSLATRPRASPCTRLPAPHRSRSGPKSGWQSRLAGLGTDRFWQELLSPHFTE